MRSELLPQANLPKYSFSADDKFIGPTIVSGLTLPGLDLPDGTPEPSAVPLRAHTEARIELLKQANLSLWHALWMSARGSLREAKTDLGKTNRHAVRMGKKLAKTAPPRIIRLVLLTLAAVAALACEYALSAPLIGPVFGFEPESWQSRCVGAIIVLCTLAVKYPLDWALHKLRGLISGSPRMQVATLLLKFALVCGVVYANFLLVYDLAPLREVAGTTFADLKHMSALNDPDLSRPTDNAENQEEVATERAAAIAIGLISVLDSLILCLAVDRTGRHAFRYWALKQTLTQYRKQRALLIDRLRTARRHVNDWQFIWDIRQDRLKAITDAMRAREECLRAPRLPEIPTRVATPVEWVEQTLQMQHQTLPYVN